MNAVNAEQGIPPKVSEQPAPMQNVDTREDRSIPRPTCALLLVPDLHGIQVMTLNCSESSAVEVWSDHGECATLCWI